MKLVYAPYCYAQHKIYPYRKKRTTPHYKPFNIYLYYVQVYMMEEIRDGHMG